MRIFFWGRSGERGRGWQVGAVSRRCKRVMGLSLKLEMVVGRLALVSVSLLAALGLGVTTTMMVGFSLA